MSVYGLVLKLYFKNIDLPIIALPRGHPPREFYEFKAIQMLDSEIGKYICNKNVMEYVICEYTVLIFYEE